MVYLILCLLGVQVYPLGQCTNQTKKFEEYLNRKRGPYNRLTPETRAAVGRYTVMNGVAATSRFFTRKLKRPLPKPTVTSIKQHYLAQRDEEGVSHLTVLPWSRQGRPLLLGGLDNKVKMYQKKLRESGGGVNTRIAMAAARGIVMHFDPARLKVNGRHIDISRTWALSLLERMTFKKRKGTTAKSKYSAEDFIERKRSSWMKLPLQQNMKISLVN